MGIAYNTSVVRNGLVLHLDAANRKSYPGSGTMWRDLSGNSNNSTLINSVVYDSANNGTMTFDGTNSYVSVPNISITNKLTVSGFVKLSSARAWQTVIGNWNSTGSGDSWLLLSSQGSGTAIPSIYVRNSTNTGGTNINGTNSLTLNTYHYLTGIFDEGKLYLYVNGNIVAQNRNVGFTSLYQNSLNLWIGRFSNYYSTSSIAQAAVYNRALSQLEIQQNFNALRGRYNI